MAGKKSGMKILNVRDARKAETEVRIVLSSLGPDALEQYQRAKEALQESIYEGEEPSDEETLVTILIAALPAFLDQITASGEDEPKSAGRGRKAKGVRNQRQNNQAVNGQLKDHANHFEAQSS